MTLSSSGSSYVEEAAARVREAASSSAAAGFSLGHTPTREELRRIVNDTLVSRSRKLAVVAGGVTVAIGLTMYVFRKETKEAVATELSDVASRSLGDEKMQAQAQLATIQTLKALLEHPETVQRTVDFVAKVAEHEQTKVALIDLLVLALKNRAVIDEALALTNWVLNDESARENLVGALISALCSERFEAAASDFVVRFFVRPEVEDAVSTLLRDASLSVLEEPHLQAKTSAHLWSAVKGLVYTPRPAKPTARAGSTAAADSAASATTAADATADATASGAAAQQKPTSAQAASSAQAAATAEVVPAAEVEAQLAHQIVGEQRSLAERSKEAVEPLLKRAASGGLPPPPPSRSESAGMATGHSKAALPADTAAPANAAATAATEPVDASTTVTAPAAPPASATASTSTVAKPPSADANDKPVPWQQLHADDPAILASIPEPPQAPHDPPSASTLSTPRWTDAS